MFPSANLLWNEDGGLIGVGSGEKSALITKTAPYSLIASSLLARWDFSYSSPKRLAKYLSQVR